MGRRSGWTEPSGCRPADGAAGPGSGSVQVQAGLAVAQRRDVQVVHRRLRPAVAALLAVLPRVVRPVLLVVGKALGGVVRIRECAHGLAERGQGELLVGPLAQDFAHVTGGRLLDGNLAAGLLAEEPAV